MVILEMNADYPFSSTCKNTSPYHQSLMEILHPPKFNGNTSPCHQSLMEILHHATKV